MADRPSVGIIIPARYASSRYPGKPLAPIRGVTGIAKPLIERSWLAARAVPDVDTICIATDDNRIAEAGRTFGADVLLTSESCRNGTERCAEAVANLPNPPEIIVNLQGDALLTPPEIVSALVKHMCEHSETDVATPAVRCTSSLYGHLIEDQAHGRVGGTTVVFDSRGHALYFSKRVIPHLPADFDLSGEIPVHLHMGVYAYRAEALRRYAVAAPSTLEQLEGLEQLRFLDIGVPVSAVSCEAPLWDVIELNNPTDLAPIEENLHARGIE